MLRTWGKLLLELLAKGAGFLPLAAERLLLTRGATTTSRKICKQQHPLRMGGLEQSQPCILCDCYCCMTPSQVHNLDAQAGLELKALILLTGVAMSDQTHLFCARCITYGSKGLQAVNVSRHVALLHRLRQPL